jgi:dephospho-CoA kinase
VEPGTPALAEIRERFGEHFIDAAGNLDRAALRKEVFASDQARSDLEAILHPRIGAETRRQANAADGNYQIIVVPLPCQLPVDRFCRQSAGSRLR